ncbi:hypothetical protein HY091_01135 [Candidatus Kaiserbacteria bacterium]|nr:hypothetical protein [Candidatus Kaiserbacteria bacterium]
MDIQLFETPYMRATLKVVQEGAGVAAYPMIETAPAACVVPMVPMIGDHFAGNECGVVLLEQEGRPETDGKPVIKAIGGYQRGMSPEECVRAFARSKAGIILPKRLRLLREATSYSVAKVPVQMFTCDEYSKVEDARLSPGCHTRLMSLREAARLAIEGKLFDPCTVETVLILRSLYTDR